MAKTSRKISAAVAAPLAPGAPAARASAGGATAVKEKPAKRAPSAPAPRPATGKGSGKHLVIVESPAKAKTINKYLGTDYVVKASMGHVRDLHSKGMGVDLETFEPEYEVIDKKAKVISELRKLARESDSVYLATDLDREGEAIAWHLKEALG